YVDSTKAREKYGADALRQWAAIVASTGSDIPFTWKDVEFGYRFMRKLWNAARFASPHLNSKVAKLEVKKIKLRPVDRWLLSRLNKLVKNVTGWLEDFQFNRALGDIQNFVWHELCDMYIEEVKHRLYVGDRTTEAAAFTLYQAMLTSAKLLAPFIPHFAEEIHQTYFVADQQLPSVHNSVWPEADESLIDESAEKLGEIANLAISTLRQFKSTRKMALNAEIPKLEIYTSNKDVAKQLEEIKDDIAGTMRVKEIKITPNKPELKERVLSVEPNLARLGSRLRGDVKIVTDALRNAKPEEISKLMGKGKMTLKEAGKTIELSIEDLKIVSELESEGHKVEVIDIADSAMTLLVSL
ncbi:MAG: class I tRNA ligase family protein, partial [Methanobacteriota archaeon]